MKLLKRMNKLILLGGDYKLKIENIEVFNTENAIRGMRNPLKSYDKSDSFWEYKIKKMYVDGDYKEFLTKSKYILGENDKKLALTLCKAGSDHRKFMRQIFISMDITAPLYWWKQMSTYKVGTVFNSESTMHTLKNEELTIDNFETDSINISENRFKNYINQLERLRIKFKETKDKSLWKELIQMLPSNFIQKRTTTFNYEVAANLLTRDNHKLTEWHELTDVIKELPNSDLIIMAAKGGLE